MTPHGRPMIFSVVAAVIYTLAYYFDWPLFQYYIENGHFRFAVETGPSILWYGWIATAAIAGLITAMSLPKRWIAHLTVDLTWLTPAALVIAALLYEQRWFN